MAPKRTTNIFITIRPRHGINDIEVGMFNGWVGKQSKQLAKYAVVVEKPNSPGQHLHCILVFHKETNQDNVKRQVKALYAALVLTDERWENPKIAIDVKAHHDPNGCVAGYLEKEEHQVLSCVGFNTEELELGRKRRNDCIDKKKKATCNKMTLLPMLINIHRHYVNEDDYPSTPAEQVEMCFNELLKQGYHNYVHHWSLSTRCNVIRYWESLNHIESD